MNNIMGEYNFAKVFTDNIEEQAINQIKELCNQEFIKDSKIRIMPDVHSGVGCTIGTTMTIENKVVPNLVGVDIGCGMLVIKLKEKNIDFSELDKVIRENIPSGMNIRNKAYDENINKCYLSKLKCNNFINMERAKLSIGTLGGGNHFIEIDKDNNGHLYLVIHTGSRYLGKQVAKYYQDIAIKKLSSIDNKKRELIDKLKSQGLQKLINDELKKIKPKKINKELAYLENDDFNDYIHDMDIVQRYAAKNRYTIANIIINKMSWSVEEEFTTIHNYIDIDDMILRKGAVSSQKGEKLIIPMNMRDGSLICIGKGNKDWNYSAPHGAGRIMSRAKAKEQISFIDYKNSMNNIWTTSVNENTIDESPFVYKSMKEIIKNIKDTVDIINIIKPIYNYKHSEND